MTLREIVDTAFAAAPAADFLGNGRGSGAPGYSVALSEPGCGTFRYAVGRRNVEQDKAMNRRTLHHIGSLTKPLTAAIILRLAAVGAFGPDGLDAPADLFLSAGEIASLSLGRDPDNPLCPADILAFNRTTQALEPTTGLCADFSLFTLRQLLNGNHGLFDFINEVDRNGNGIIDASEYALGSFFDALGVPRLVLPEDTETAFDLLAANGVLANPGATIGGQGLEDFETSFGNTGYTLLGIIAERATGLSYNQLLWLSVGSSPGTFPMFSITAPPHPEWLISRQYLVTTGAELAGVPEDLFGVYPLVEIAGNPAVNVYELDDFIVTNGGGGAGSVVATPNAYRFFFRGLLEGGLLSTQEQELFDGGFVPITELPGVRHGFGVFQFEDPEFGPGFAKSGQVTGSACQALHFSDPGSTVVVCRNSVDAFLGGAVPASSTSVGDLARELVRAVHP